MLWAEHIGDRTIRGARADQTGGELVEVSLTHQYRACF